MQHRESTPIWTKRFISLFITNMSVFFVFYGLVTTLPLYAIDVLKQTDKEGGLLLSIFLLSAIIVRPFSGKLLDLFGKKRMLLISLVLYFACTVLYIFIKPLIFLMVLRFVNGIWFSIVTTAVGSLAADIVPESRKGTGLGYFSMSTNLAVVLGPFVGLLLIHYASYNALFYTLSTFVVIGGLIALTVNTDDLPQGNLKGGFSITFNDLFEKKALPISLIAMLISFAYASVLSFISVYAQHKELMDVASWFYAVFAATMILTRPLVGKIYDTKGAQYVILPGLVLYGIGLCCLAFVSGPILFLLSGALIGIGYGALTTSLQSLAIQSTAPTRSGYATATYFTLFDIGIAIGSYILGMIAVSRGYSSVYLVGFIVVILTSVIFLILQNRLIKKRI